MSHALGVKSNGVALSALRRHLTRCGVDVPEPFESMVDGDEPSKATKLSKRQYVRVTETLTGAQRGVSGPTLFFPGSHLSADAQDALLEGRHVAIDRCNFDQEQRAHWLRLHPPQPAIHLSLIHI